MKQQNNTIDNYVTKEKNHCFFSLTTLCLSLLSLHFTAYSNNALAETAPNLAKPKIVVPDKISGVDTLSAEQVLKALMAEQAPLLVDARIKQDREYGYIESSISLPDINTNCKSLASTISTNKNKTIIFYCNGVQCGRSVVSIKVARSCGYQNLSWFKGGFAEWKEKGYQYLTQQ